MPHLTKTNGVDEAAPHRTLQEAPHSMAHAIDHLVMQRNEFLRFVQRRVDSRAIAEDIIQSAYLRAIEQASKLRKEESAAAWFYRILRNAVIDHYRRRAVEDRALEIWARELTNETIADPETERMVCECIVHALPEMKDSYSEVIRMVDLGGSSLDSFAQAVGISAGNAAVRMHRARQALKKQLILICGTCSKHGCVNCTCARDR